MAAVDLAFEEFGKDNPETIIILHGFFASSRNWRQISGLFADNLNLHVYALDMRHHGVSPAQGIMDYPAMTGDVLAFMDNHGLLSVHVLGHSMGGKIAMWLALAHPERINKLIVADIAPKSYSHGFETVINALMALPLEEISNRKQAEMMLVDAIPQLSYRQFLLQNLVLKGGRYQWRVDLPVFLASSANITGFPDARHLQPYRKSALFIAGENSHYLKKSDIADLFPEAEFETIADTGHWLHSEKPDVFSEVVGNFLQREG